MNGLTFYLSGGSALKYAGRCLSERGVHVARTPGGDVTHLLLGVPSFDAAGQLKGGGELEELLAQLPKDITVVGGNLDHPALKGYKTADLLQDPIYLAQNAAITADCAMRIAGSNMPVVFCDCPILVIGWGRIGKCLAAKLKAAGADVTVAARKESDVAMLKALGYSTEYTDQLRFGLIRYRVIFNTVPFPVLSSDQLSHCRPDCVKIDLASRKGIAGDDVIWARGLPGTNTPESSGCLIAKSAIRLAAEKEA